MSKTEFLQGLKAELEGRVPYSMIQENLRYYDSYITEESGRGQPEEAVIEGLGGPKLIARSIVDAAFDTEDRPDVFDSFGTGPAGGDAGTSPGGRRKGGETGFEDNLHRHVHYVNFGKWYVRLFAGLAVFLVIFLIMTVFFGILGLAGWVLSYLWPVLLVMMLVWMFRGSGRR